MGKEDNQDDVQAIAKALRGQTLRVPDMAQIFKDWPSPPANPLYEELTAFVDGLIESMLDAPERVNKHKRDDYALFTAMWFPFADWSTLKTLAYYTIWLFLWDDSVDTAEHDLSIDIIGANEYRTETICIFQKFICGAKRPRNVQVDGINGVIETFADRLGVSFTSDQRRRFLKEVKVFIAACGKEQQARIAGEVPDYGPYIELRLGTSAVYTLCALVEFVIGASLPGSIVESHAVRDLWTEANMGVIYVNDILSLRKELKTMCVSNAVSALMKQGADLDGAVAELVRKLRASVAKLDSAAEELKKEVEPYEDEVLEHTVWEYCDACRIMVTSTFRFSLVSDRYGIQECINPDGTLDIEL